jgi:hypothetical protein
MSSPILSLTDHQRLLTLEAAERFQNAVRPLFRLTRKRGEPWFIGSSVLVCVGPQCFALSAAHVFDVPPEEKTPAGVRGGVMATFGSDGAEAPVELHGVLHTTPIPASRNRRDDRIDVAVLELGDSEAKGIDDALFLSPSDFDIRDAEAPRQPYLLLGFPDSKQKRDVPAARYETQLGPFTGYEAPTGDYDALGVTRQTHLAIRFDPSSIRGPSGQLRQGVHHPDGKSGGGWWRIDQQFGPVSADINMKLVATMSEYDRPKAKALLATRINSHVELIAKARPDLAGYLPEQTWASTVPEVHSGPIP